MANCIKSQVINNNFCWLKKSWHQLRKVMHKLIIIALILSCSISFPQSVEEVQKPQTSEFIESLFKDLRAKRDSGFSVAVRILEKGLEQAETEYEIHKITLNLSFLYTKTEQFDKCIDMWIWANKQGVCYNFELGKYPEPEYIVLYQDNPRFKRFLNSNDSSLKTISQNSKAQYFVEMPIDFDDSIRYPTVIIMHGGIGSFYNTFQNWQSDLIRNQCIAVYTQGREMKGTIFRSYGSNGLNDIKEIYRQVSNNYPVDMSKVILAGQSAGGAMSLALANGEIKAKGVFLAFPVKPGDFDITQAYQLRNDSTRVYMICGEQDKYFYSGQVELGELLDNAGVDNEFIKYPRLGHRFPKDFTAQVDKGLEFLLRIE